MMARCMEDSDILIPGVIVTAHHRWQQHAVECNLCHLWRTESQWTDHSTA